MKSLWYWLSNPNVEKLLRQKPLSAMEDKMSFRKFGVEGETIHWKGASYSLSAVRHLIYSQVSTTRQANFVTLSKSRSSKLCIVLEDGHKIALSCDEATIVYGLSTDKAQTLQNIHDIYVYLATKTFEKRMSSYVRQVEEQGFFEHNRVLYYPHCKVKCGRTEFLLRNSEFTRTPGYLDIQLRYSDVLGRIRSALTAVRLSTDLDTDVFFSLLQHYMGLRWKY